MLQCYACKKQIHCFSFLLIQNMSIAVKSKVYACVSEYNAQSFNVNAFFNGSCCKGVTEGMKISVCYSCFFDDTFESFL